jgi:hypothetical protein
MAPAGFSSPSGSGPRATDAQVLERDVGVEDDMSYKELDSGNKNVPPRVVTPEEAELKARAMARHKAKEARREEHRAGNKGEQHPAATRRDPQEH